MKSFTAVLILSLVVLSCNSVDQLDPEHDELLMSCNVQNPIDDLEWLKEIAEEYDKAGPGHRIIKLVENNGSPYIITKSMWAANPGRIYDCKGNGAGILARDFYDFEKQSRLIKILYEKR
ncbi:hypothetical protein [Algoriphagus sp.]|uniref:hypothetical protein n=1 Tax=Algoriphagus sp. TaxID=1872435 RepID=UPI003F72CC7C